MISLSTKVTPTVLFQKLDHFANFEGHSPKGTSMAFAGAIAPGTLAAYNGRSA